MKTPLNNDELRALLRDADPVSHEPGLSADAIAEMRRAVLSAVPDDGRHAPVHSRFFTLAAAAALVVVASIAIVKWPETFRAKPVSEPAAVSGSGERRQMQFATPGGTRIIWTFDPAFQLKEARQ